MQKFKTVLALLSVFLLVLTTNLVDKDYFEQVQESVSSVYNDRLVTKNYIYKFSRLLNSKQNIYHKGTPQEIKVSTKSANDSIDALIEKYERADLTSKEAKYFEAFKEKINNLEALEAPLISGEQPFEDDTKKDIEAKLTLILADLDNLSQIQIDEGRRQLNVSTRIIESSNLIARFEIGFLIIIGLIIQIVIIYKPKN